MILSRLIYLSKTNDNANLEQLEDILEKSRDRNLRDDITGVLLFHADYYIQILEGELQKLNETFQRISKDERHNTIMILKCSPVNERFFPEWSMGYIAENHITKSTFLKYSGARELCPLNMHPDSIEKMLFELSQKIATTSE